MAFDGRETETESARLRKDVEWALRRALDPTDVLPMLHRLARTAKVGTDESVFAHRQLAELIAPRHPWRAALYARRVVGLRPLDDRAWAVLAFAQTLLGHYRYAATAYARALGCSPKNPWYAHNLGHLLDVALGRSEEALPWLASAYAAAPDHSELATSYAHALARSGDVPQAKRVLGRAMRSANRSPSREQSALWRWLERGAPPPKAEVDKSANVPTYIDTPFFGALDEAASDQATLEELEETGRDEPSLAESDFPERDGQARIKPSRKRTRGVSSLEETLERGLDHLPLDARQRARAKSLARDLARPGVEAGNAEASKLEATAAAIAYAVVDLDEVPLTQAEVAACFRVRVASLRARYDELRAELLLLGARASARRLPAVVARMARQTVSARGLGSASALEASAKLDKPARRRRIALSQSALSQSSQSSQADPTARSTPSTPSASSASTAPRVPASPASPSASSGSPRKVKK